MYELHWAASQWLVMGVNICHFCLVGKVEQLAQKSVETINGTIRKT